MLFLGLGTGLGSAVIIDGVLEPTELAHLPYKKGRTYEDYVGRPGSNGSAKRNGETGGGGCPTAQESPLQADYVVLGGGNAKLLKSLPHGFVSG